MTIQICCACTLAQSHLGIKLCSASDKFYSDGENIFPKLVWRLHCCRAALTSHHLRSAAFDWLLKVWSISVCVESVGCAELSCTGVSNSCKTCLILALNSMPSFCHFVTKIRPPFVISFKSIRENSPNTSRLIVAIIIFLQHLPVEKRLWWADGRILSCATPLQILCHSAACCSFKLIFMKHFYAALSESFQCSILQFLHRQTFHRYI